MKKVFSLMICLPLFAKAQEEKGIKFEQGLSWQQVLAKAKTENKYIFLDAYATWCGPCKAMDKFVYTNEKVGELANGKFISIKVQMDTSKNDDNYVKDWYSDANFILHQYNVNAYPTLLFFSSEGKLVHKGIGARSIEDFLSLAMTASNPDRQYYNLIENYKNGIRDYLLMGELAKEAKLFNDKKMADSIAKDYKTNYLDKLSDHELFTKDNIDFVCFQFVALFYSEGSNGRFFKFFYQHPEITDSIMKWKGLANFYTKSIISNEEIFNNLWYNDTPITKEPDWNKLELNIKYKYPEVNAGPLILAAQQFFYRKINNWDEYAKINDAQIKKEPPKRGTGLSADPWKLNVAAWDVFLNCNEKKILLKALKWSNISIKLETDVNLIVQYYDTKANLLYKIGKPKEAIDWEKRAIDQDNANAKKSGKEKGQLSENEYYPTLAKMKEGKPTWVVK